LIDVSEVLTSSITKATRHSSPNIIRQIKSRRMRWAGNVARMGRTEKVYQILVGNPEGKRLLGNQGIDGNWNQNGS
jgi:hypothetical protein